MDDIVKAALKKWPNVPACYDWLALDARGDWYMRDERTQAAGPFPQIKGSRILHEKLREFIHRNYECDERGAWYFQNGPQRVYVALESTPWVWRVMEGPDAAVFSHTGRPATVQQPWLDEEGRLYLETDLGIGLVHSLDMHAAAGALEAGVWGRSDPGELRFEDMPRRFGFCRAPRGRTGGDAAPAPG